jgi:hypothetical protein
MAARFKMGIFEYWKEVDSLKTPIHPRDLRVLEELSHYVESDLNYDFPPGPYFGSLKNAKIVLCYANPGIDEPSLETIQSIPNRELLLKQLDGKQPYPYQLLGWKEWFSQRANSLFGGDQQLASEKLAVFNLFPYASRNMDNVEKVATCLPSVWVAQSHLREELIPRALAGEVLLVMCRSAHLWGLRSEHGSNNILINTVRSGFTERVKKRVQEWRLEQGI